MIRIIRSIGNDNMVHEEQSHQLASLSYLLCQKVIRLTWSRAIARMIMSESYNRCIIERCLADYHSNIHSSFSQTTLTYLHILNQLEVLIHQQQVCLFMV